MFCKVRKLANEYGRRILSLALAPIIFLGTLPRTACICADGHREPSCPAVACRLIASGSNTRACCERNCGNVQGSRGERSCCRGKQGQPSSDSQAANGPVGKRGGCGNGSWWAEPTLRDGLSAKRGGCCNPVVESPAPIVSAGRSEVASQSAVAANVPSQPMLLIGDQFRAWLAPMGFSRPPPLDAVIVFLHLTI
jgi:hypothetical protein